MPTTPPKARILLKGGNAKVTRRTPFTIQLLYGSSGYKQPIMLGVDSGYEHVGLSAITEKQELFSAEVLLRKDVSKLLTERRAYRRNRRDRKVRYRQPRFLNRVRTKRKGWLAPPIQHKLDSHIKVVNKVSEILPITNIIVEVANFDVQRIKNPEIKGKEYQEGDQFGFENVRAYVLHRDEHKCQHCKGKSGNKHLNTHHIVFRSKGGSDRPDNLITLCKTCHDKQHKGLIKLKVSHSRSFKTETFMSIVRYKIVERLRELYNNADTTYGYITKALRKQLFLTKSHINDAFIIAGANIQIRNTKNYLIKQVRKQNRKLFKGARSHTKNTAQRFLFGFQRYDKVKFNNKDYHIFGRRQRGCFKLSNLESGLLKTEPTYKKLKLLESFKTFLWEVKMVPNNV
jgi:N6-L-threonylcarbamoyladenine synthase